MTISSPAVVCARGGILAIFAAFAGAEVFAAVAPEWQLTFRVTETTTTLPSDPPAGAAKASPRGGGRESKPASVEAPGPGTTTREFTQRVSLGDGYLVVADVTETEIYDFAAKRFHRVSAGSDVFTDMSLYAHCASRVQELQNRFHLGGALQAAGIKMDDVLFAPFDMECLFGLQIPGRGTLAGGAKGDPFTREVDADGTLRFVRDGTVVTSFRPDASAVPADRRDAWGRFLLYTCAIHPRIRAQIVADGHLPARLEFVEKELKRTREVSLELVEEAAVAGRAVPDRLAGRSSEPPVQSKALLAVLAKLANTPPPTREGAVAAAERAIADRHPLDGLLMLLEYGLQTGDQPVAEMRAHNAVFQADKQCQRFFGGKDQSSKAACEHSLASYDSIDRKGLTKAYVLDILRANLVTKLGKPREAEGLLLAALDANPFLAGVYNDLGGIYYSAYEIPQAWVCWDTGRRLYPGHTLLGGVTDLEQRFERDFPEFF